MQIIREAIDKRHGDGLHLFVLEGLDPLSKDSVVEGTDLRTIYPDSAGSLDSLSGKGISGQIASSKEIAVRTSSRDASGCAFG